MRIRLVWTVHNLVPHKMMYGSKEKDEQAMRIMASWALEGIIHTESSKREFEEKYGDGLPLTVIPHGNFLDETILLPQDEARQRLGISAEKVVVLMIGPDRWEKGIETFISVVGNLPPDYFGVITGRCTDPSIVDFINDRCGGKPDEFMIRLETLPREEIHWYFAAGDIFFMPFKRITSSASIIDAMGHKKAVVTTPLGDLRELVKNGVNGYLCDSEEEMRRAITMIDRDKAAVMGEQGYLAVKPLSWDGIADSTIEVYSRVLR